MKTSLLTIALFVTLLFWSSCKEKSTEPLSTPEVIERIEFRPYYTYLIRDSIVLTENTFEMKSSNVIRGFQERPDTLFIWDTTHIVTKDFYESIVSTIDIDSFFAKDSIYFTRIMQVEGRPCWPKSYEYEFILTTNTRSKSVLFVCSADSNKYEFDDALTILYDHWRSFRRLYE